jgi:hypothetical protein
LDGAHGLSPLARGVGGYRAGPPVTAPRRPRGDYAGPRARAHTRGPPPRATDRCDDPGSDESSRLSSAWLSSPFDVDEDGIAHLRDNCPLVFNPDQADTDGDERGDACASDYDGDGRADHLDRAPGDGAVSGPPEVEALVAGQTALTVLT